MKTWKSILEKVAVEYRLDPNLMRALIQVESAGRTHAMRYEPNWKYLYHVVDLAELNHITAHTEEQLQKFSYGLCQMMGSVIRELGFRGMLTECLNPEILLPLMAKKLRILSDKYGSESDVIVSWNAGSPIRTPAGTYINERYHDLVSIELRKLRSLK